MRPHALLAALALVAGLFALAKQLHFDDRLAHELAEWRHPNQAAINLGRYQAVQQHQVLPLQGGAEASGLAWHAPSGTLLSIAGKPSTLAQISPQGEVLRQTTLHNIADPEGIEVLPDGRLAVLEERNATLVVFPLPTGTSTNLQHALRFQLSTSAPELLHPTNKGPEGLAWDSKQQRFIIAKEKPTALYALPFNLATNQFGTLTRLRTGHLFVRDISGLSYHQPSGHWLVLSHNSSLLLELDQAFNPVSYMSFATLMNGMRMGIRQAEGVAITPQGAIFVVGEPNYFYQFAPRPQQP